MHKECKILAIETSCDETAAAVIYVRNNHNIKALSSVVSSQIKLHQKTQGVVPEVAARAHIKKINSVVKKALRDANTGLAEINYIAPTIGPGLITSLIVGTEYAKALAFALDKPLLPTNHMLGHLYSPFLQHPKMPMPNISLIVSGGHTYLIHMRNRKNIRVIGQTVDDAAGEAFDKVARMLKLPYPGGPEISKQATLGKHDYNLPRPMLYEKNYNFSFAGLKTAVLYLIRDKKLNLNDKQTVADIAYSFENAAVDVLISKMIRAAREYGAKSIALSGGVAANSKLRTEFAAAATKLNITPYIPEFSLCTDNALMIGNAAAIALENGTKPKKYSQIKVDPNLKL